MFGTKASLSHVWQVVVPHKHKLTKRIERPHDGSTNIVLFQNNNNKKNCTRIEVLFNVKIMPRKFVSLFFKKKNIWSN